ncbi:hypothetical protein RB598_005354 [Gaeumannomyces tritici]
MMHPGLRHGISSTSQQQKSSPTATPDQHHQQHHQTAAEPPPVLGPDSGDDANVLTGDDRSDNDLDDHLEPTRNGKRKRPISVSCELCKQRKVKCDRDQPSCGWCTRNGAICEYKERKKPGLRAGYGRELEQRLDRLESILRTHQEILRPSMDGPGVYGAATFRQGANAAQSVRDSIHSDQDTSMDILPPLFPRPDSMRTPRTETALFVQKPSAYAPAPPGQSQNLEFANLGGHTPTPHDGFQAQAGPAGISPSGVSPGHMGAAGISSAAAQEYYGAGSTGPSTSGGAIHSPNSTKSQSQTQISSDQEFPPYDMLYALADLYFKHVNTWCPILNRKITLASLFDSASTIDETDKILLHAIVATTLRFSTDSRLTEESRRRYHDVSKKRVLLYGMENSSVKALQALVILALDLCGDGNGPPGWNIMALITRSVVQLGLAVESNSFSVSPNYTSIYTLRAMILPEPRDFIEEESRRRLFWMVYLLDRYATIPTAFEFALDDKEIDRKLPCRDDLWLKNQKVETRWFRTEHRYDESAPPDYEANKPENLGAFSYYVEVLTILSQIHKFLKQPVDISAVSDVEDWKLRYKELDSALAKWKFDLPGEYSSMAKLFQPGVAKTLNCGWVMLHATYHTAAIRLHSSAAYPTTRSPIFTPSYSASQRCHDAVENIAALGDFVVTNGLLPKLGPPFAFTLWVAARLLLVHGSTVEHKVSPQIGFFVDALREMSRYWPVARRYCELLQRVLDEYHDAARHGDSVTPSSVKILADMRRTAFDLDFLISRQPHHMALTATGGSSAACAGSSGVSVNGAGSHGPGAPGPGGAPVSGPYSRYPSITPARTPQPNELEYLDVFDFFNYPRLAAGVPGDHPSGVQGNIGGVGGAGGRESGDVAVGGGSGPGPNEFNIEDFMVDANHDWLYKQEGGGKFMS